MPTISLCMIVKNEEQVLARCLDSAAGLVDEIIIVDTGSADQTVAIAQRYTSCVYLFPWNDDFAAARNYSFSKATKEYCMWLDADDVIEEQQQKKFLQMKAELPPDVDIVVMKYHAAFDETDNPVLSYNRERIIRNDGTHFWEGEVHEAIVPTGKLLYSEIGICHKKIGLGTPGRNLNIYRKMLAEHKILEPRHQYYYARELYYHSFYQTALEVFLSFLEDERGWVEDKIEACRLCCLCYQQLGQEQESLRMLFRSFEMDQPRAEICCEIGQYFLTRENYKLSIYWYERAAEAEKRPDGGGFVLPDCYGYLPFIQICSCYASMGNMEKAKEYNDKAGKYKPKSPVYLLNKQYFDKRTVA